MVDKNIFVTRPNLPPLEEFIPYLKEIWESAWLTNNGTFHSELEKSLAEYLNVPYISLFANGTLALLTAIQALELKGEVITTPYSFVATSHALWWNNITPVFVDVDPIYGNLNPDNIEAAISAKTTAILPVHVYGNPCEFQKIQDIAEKYKLKVIYDAAHTFGVKGNEFSLFDYGDLSIISFHATKIFSTIEGGAVICNSAEMKQHLDDLKNFGFRNETTVVAPGINAKMNEVQAAFGLASLKYIDNNIDKCRQISDIYNYRLKSVPGIRILERNTNVRHNYSYFPIFIEEQDYGISREELYEALKSKQIFSRRYFYPLISQFSPYSKLSSAQNSNLPIANQLANTVLCLPIYSTLEVNDVEKICDLIVKLKND
jgi:dTDP-4-amino-4,6-dideoxygalactose transaminase